MLRTLLLCCLFAVVVQVGERYKLPNVQYPRETDPAKMTPLDKYVHTYDDSAGYSVYDHHRFVFAFFFCFLFYYFSFLAKPTQNDASSHLTLCLPFSLFLSFFGSLSL